MESNELKERLSANLKKLRKEKRWSQFDLAEKAEISEQTVNSIEGFRLWPSDRTLAKICTALNTDAYKLFMPTINGLSEEDATVRALEALIAKKIKDSVDKTLDSFIV